jgi:putative membrane protein
MGAVSLWTRLYLALVIFSVLGTAFCNQFSRPPGLIAPVSAGLTLIIGLIAVFRSAEGMSRGRILFGLAALVILGTSVELVGVSTGLPFGSYSYTPNWQPVIAIPGYGWFPILLPFAWALMVAACTFISAPVGRDKRARPMWAPVAGVVAAGIDLVMEPAMTGPLAYWRWETHGPLPGGAPILNTFGWFLTATLGAGILIALGAKPERRGLDAALVLGGHIALVAVIALLPVPHDSPTRRTVRYRGVATTSPNSSSILQPPCLSLPCSRASLPSYATSSSWLTRSRMSSGKELWAFAAASTYSITRYSNIGATTNYLC